MRACGRMVHGLLTLRIALFVPLCLLGLHFWIPVGAQNLFLHKPPRSVPHQGEVDPRILYVLSFARDLQWPQMQRAGNFYIEVVGRPIKLSQELESVARGYTVGGRPVQVKHTVSWSDRSSFHRPNLVLVQREARPLLPTIQRFFQGTPVLVVCDFADFNEGWMVSFIEREGDSAQWDVALSVENIESNSGIIVPDSFKRKVSAQGTRQQETQQRVRKLETLLATREAQIADQLVIMREQHDTIERQREEIINLRNDMYRSQVANFHLSITGPSLPSGAIPTPQTLEPRVYSTDYSGSLTSPWRERSVGYTVVLIMSVLSLISVLALYSIPYTFFASSPLQHGVSHPEKGKGDEDSLSPSVAGMLLGAAARRSRERGQAGAVEPSAELLGAHVTEAALGKNFATLGDGGGEGGDLCGYNPRLRLQEARSTHDSEAMRQVAEDAMRLKRALLANISHEIRTPLNAIVSLSQFVAETSSADTDVKESMGIINQNAFELIRMVNNVISMAQLETGDLTLETESFPLRGMLLMVERVGLQHMESRGKREELCLSICEESLSQDDAKTLTGDREKIMNVLEQLILLAVDSLAEGTIEVGYCTVESREGAEPGLHLFVRDSGGQAGWSIQQMRARKLSLENSLEDGMSLEVIDGLLALMGSQLEECWHGQWHQVQFRV